MTGLIPLLLLAFVFLFILFYRLSKPLKDEQILRLAHKRRQKKISQYFASSSWIIVPPLHFKKSLKPDGKLYELNLNLPDVPSFVANLLKYKKHEWSVIAFIADRKMQYLWTNKGPDRSQVNLVSINFIIETAKKSNCDVIMAFHNHPAHDPQYYSYRNPSNMDLQSAQKYAEILNSANISYLDHICERGTAYRYFLKPSENLYPLQEILNNLGIENLQGKMTHMKLHLELYL
jgi:hypothetical protein